MSEIVKEAGPDFLTHKVDITDFLEMLSKDFSPLYNYISGNNPQNRPLEMFETLKLCHSISMCDDATLPKVIDRALEKEDAAYAELEEAGEDGIDEIDDVVDDSTEFLHTLSIALRRRKSRIIEIFQPLYQVLG